MGPVSLMATSATEKALLDAGLINNDVITNGQTGIAYGSSTGSTSPTKAFGNLLNNNSYHRFEGETNSYQPVAQHYSDGSYPHCGGETNVANTIDTSKTQRSDPIP